MFIREFSESKKSAIYCSFFFIVTQEALIY